ncbi:hypothetical protein P5V15_000418, partial [Pogonomyrmex californicus]
MFIFCKYFAHVRIYPLPEVSIASRSSSSASTAKMNLRWILPWMWCFLITSECYNIKNTGEDGSKLIRIGGDIILGGIFPMHEQVAGQLPCGAVKEEKGMQRLEAMLYVLDEINADIELLPNTTLGALIIDSCSSDTYALDQSMEFVRSYMNQGIASFIALSARYNICVAISEKILRNARTEDFDKIIERLSSKHSARGVIIFVDEDNIRKLLQATVRANRTGHFMWVGSDSWGAKVHPVRDQEFAAEGAITILPYRNALKGFDDYYLSLRPRIGDECGGQTESNVPHKSLAGKIVNCRNIWFREFWSQHHKCTFSVNASSDATRCTGLENLVDYEQEGLVPFVVDAVYAMAHGVHNVIEEECVNNLGTPHYLCKTLEPAPDGPRLLQHIRNVTFIGRQNTEIKFNSDGDAYGFYNIYQYQRKDEGRFDYTLIGTWRE